jgi:predicted DNA-binding transcriptional regulator AlpA
MEERRPARLLKLPDVAERVGLSPSSFLKGMKESGFPAGFKHGNNRLWLESEVGSRC